MSQRCIYKSYLSVLNFIIISIHIGAIVSLLMLFWFDPELESTLQGLSQYELYLSGCKDTSMEWALHGVSLSIWISVEMEMKLTHMHTCDLIILTNRRFLHISVFVHTQFKLWIELYASGRWCMRETDVTTHKLPIRSPRSRKRNLAACVCVCVCAQWLHLFSLWPRRQIKVSVNRRGRSSMNIHWLSEKLDETSRA